jgi:hypothetical protein
MQLDPIRSDPGLTVDQVEEADPSHGRRAVQVLKARARLPAGGDQIAARSRQSVLFDRVAGALTSDIRELNDHRLRAVLRAGDDEMDIAVILADHPDQLGLDSVGRLLGAWQAGSLGPDRGPRLVPEAVDGCGLGTEIDLVRPSVGERLHTPALLAALQLGVSLGMLTIRAG